MLPIGSLVILSHSREINTVQLADDSGMNVTDRDTPYAIAMWDFSWLERRYEGGGYSDWDTALDELITRGYDAVRIDAYPHLVSADPTHEWTLPPAFEASEWGAPTTCHVEVFPALTEFITACADRDVAVALSSWFREDTTNVRRGIHQPADLASVWIETLDSIADTGLLDTVAWVDLCNEFPLSMWAPYFNNPDDDHHTRRRAPAARRWITESIASVRSAYPEQAYCFSETAGPGKSWGREPEPEMDLIDTHLWLMNTSDFFDWSHDIDSAEHYVWIEKQGQRRYKANPSRWHSTLEAEIDAVAEWSRTIGLPLTTTESWALIHYKDWPGLNWDWIKELCAVGTQKAAETGRWAAISTSNFCGPQFRGMWNDVEWHQTQTAAIKNATIEV
ncbi:cellulase-like family protein [Halocatena marina]|uniref:cellulase-like family protein n=1 Tax=Halocatena marina TaxID=2934937 RepID=UPI00200E8B1A|nr:cellulase-like family protein [Halocatena marina]